MFYLKRKQILDLVDVNLKIRKRHSVAAVIAAVYATMLASRIYGFEKTVNRAGEQSEVASITRVVGRTKTSVGFSSSGGAITNEARRNSIENLWD